MTVNLSTSSSKGSFAPDSPLTIPSGVGSVSFQYTDDSVGTPTLTATAGGLASATQQETINPAAASRLAFTTAPQTLTTGVASTTMTVALEDAFGNPVEASSALTIGLDTTSGTGTFTPASPLTIPAGGSSFSFRYTDASAGAPVLSASSGSLSLATQQEIVNPAPASRLAIITTPQTLTAGTASGTITVELEDAAGEPVDAASTVTVTLTSTSSAGTFAPASPLTVPAGADSVNFTYTDTKAGTPTLTISAAGLGSTAQQETVTAAAASQVIFTTAPQTIVAGIASQPIIVAIADRFGNLASAGSAVAVNLSADIRRGHVCSDFAPDHSAGRQLDELHLLRYEAGNADDYRLGGRVWPPARRNSPSSPWLPRRSPATSSPTPTTPGSGWCHPAFTRLGFPTS